MGNNDDIFMARYSAFNPYRMRYSDMGYQQPIGAGDAMAKSLYCGMKPIASWLASTKCVPTGGVFNLEFSPEGSLLVAACEKKTIQIFDPLTHKRIHSVVGAHLDCVNCVKFLDGRMFATCSDDTTIALWDVRNLKKKIRSLLGHSKWVKNIEFSVKDKLLVTSGLDGSIYTWDINSYTESNLVYQRVFHTSSLMRCRLSPDARQMVMCTTGGLLVIIHDLNLSTLAQDLRGFKPNMYRLMQMSQQLLPIAAMYDHLFDGDRKENRVEFVSDFPEGNDAEVVSALQIHPQGWSALSRNISHDDRSEWTCIHDIQSLPASNKSVVESPRPPRRVPPPPRRRPRPRARPYRSPRPQQGEPQDPPHDPPLARDEEAHSSRESSEEREQPIAGPSRPRVALVAVEGFRLSPSGRGGEASGSGAHAVYVARADESPPARVGIDPRSGRGGEASGSGAHAVYVARADEPPPARVGIDPRNMQNDVWEAAITIKQHRLLQEIYSRGQVRPNFNMQRITGVNTGITPPPPSLRPVPPCDNPADRPSSSGHSPRDSISEVHPATRHYIRQNRNRLLYYTEETNEGKGFIKELCYSADGRVVCSPFGRGMRLLALHRDCTELPHAQWGLDSPQPQVMQEIGQSLGIHRDLVVSSRFSPRFHLLVTGCLEGKIVWYQPYSGEALY